MNCIKQDSALALYYAGETKTFIRKTLKIQTKRLNKWINEDRKTTKEQIIHLFFFGYSKNKICKAYNLSNNTFDLWGCIYLI
jgi:hypothetical protein